MKRSSAMMTCAVASSRGRLAPAALSAILLLGCGDDPWSTESGDASPKSSKPACRWFKEITAECGLTFVHESGARGGFHMPEIMGPGAALFDFDNDGDLDIYLINGNLTLNGEPDDGSIRDRLYRQDDGNFVDVTESSGLGDSGYGMGAAIGDIDNDGDLDVFVTNYGPAHLFRNSGDGTFQDISQSAGINVNGWTASATFVDYDRNGFLDLYVTRYVMVDLSQRCDDAAGRRDYCGPQAFTYQPHVLLRNLGDPVTPRFADVSEPSGITSAAAPGLGVVCDDFNGDRWPDIAVANDGEANFLWINQQDGTFRDMAVLMGFAYNMHGVPLAGMGIIAEDLDNDSHPDAFVTNLTNQTNTFFHNRGDNTGFEDLTGPSGLGASSLIYTGFGTAAFDVELDGDLDLLVVNGKVQRSHPRPGTVVPPPLDVYAEPNLLYVNDDGASFTAINDQLSTFTSHIEITRALAVGDIDRDGDLDVLTTNLQGPARLYRNDAKREGHWLMVRAIDPKLKREALGAQVTLTVGQRTLVRTIRRGFSYLSSSDAAVHFGLGSEAAVERIDVLWPDGSRERFAGAAIGPVDRHVTLIHGEGEALP
jgi:hypothetical protein